MDKLIEKIRASRNLTIDVGTMKFMARRPTSEEIGNLVRDKSTDADIVRRFVFGWEGVCESDLIKGGSETPVAFDRELFCEAIGDLDNLWGVIIAALFDAHIAYKKKNQEQEKN